MRILIQEQFIEKAKLIHANKYDYLLVEYVNARTKTKIIYPEHSIFKQTPSAHLLQKQKCIGNILSSKEEFINKSIKIHGDKYDYSLVEYKTNKINIKTICPKHGIFEQRPDTHTVKNVDTRTIKLVMAKIK